MDWLFLKSKINEEAFKELLSFLSEVFGLIFSLKLVKLVCIEKTRCLKIVWKIYNDLNFVKVIK